MDTTHKNWNNANEQIFKILILDTEEFYHSLLRSHAFKLSADYGCENYFLVYFNCEIRRNTEDNLSNKTPSCHRSRVVESSVTQRYGLTLDTPWFVISLVLDSSKWLVFILITLTPSSCDQEHQAVLIAGVSGCCSSFLFIWSRTADSTSLSCLLYLF